MRFSPKLVYLVALTSERIAERLNSDAATRKLGPIAYGSERFTFPASGGGEEVTADVKDVGQGEHFLGVVDSGAGGVTFWARNPGSELNAIRGLVVVDMGGSHQSLHRARLDDENAVPHLMNIGRAMGGRCTGVPQAPK